MKYGELFAGVGGLGRAVGHVFDAEPGWFAEVAAAPSKVLAFHHPDVLNLGDVSSVDWSAPELRVDVLAGGFPCQDVSLAGRRKGMKAGTRSGLWAEFVKAIDAIRPDWVVIENVRGLLSAGADSDVEQCPWCLGDESGEHALRALGAVLGDLADLGFDAEWAGVRASDVGAAHGRFRVFIVAWPVENTGCRRERGGGYTPGHGERAGANVEVDRSDFGVDWASSASVTLLPTPRALDGQQSMSAPANRRHVEAGFGNLPETVGYYLLPTPRTTDMNGPGLHGNGGMDLRTAIDNKPADRWGPYATALERWGNIIGRPAPEPVKMDGRNGQARLNPELTEWMMGWPEGWVTSPEIGLSRAEQLKACGNGVVTLQAVAAVTLLLSRDGVPMLGGVS